MLGIVIFIVIVILSKEALASVGKYGGVNGGVNGGGNGAAGARIIFLYIYPTK